MLVEQRLTNEMKSAGLAYFLWFFLGGFAAHRFYLGQTGTAVAQLVLFWGGMLLAGLLIGIPMLIAFTIWWIVDAFLIGGLVRQHTDQSRSRIVNEVSLTTTSGA
ncbi:MAG: TM2 domain-containing protein [Rhodobacteraceae bacterium]|nr:TM2 domain-containing protein [Paracoccaceae bacterium]